MQLEPCYKATANTYWVRHRHTVKLTALTRSGNLECIQLRTCCRMACSEEDDSKKEHKTPFH